MLKLAKWSRVFYEIATNNLYVFYGSFAKHSKRKDGVSRSFIQHETKLFFWDLWDHFDSDSLYNNGKGDLLIYESFSGADGSMVFIFTSVGYFR